VQFVLPDDLTALSADDLEAAERDALDEFDALREVGDALTDEQVDDMEALAAHVGTIRLEQGRREEAAAERRARAEAATALVAEPEDSTDTPEEGEADEPDDAPDEGDADDTGAPGEPQAEDETPVPVAASGVVRRSRRVPNPTPKRKSPLTLTAAADIPNVVNGSRLADLRAASQAFIGRSAGFPSFEQGGDAPLPGEPGGPAAGIYNRYSVATISRNDRDGLDTANRDFESVESLLDEAGRQSRLKGGSLVAAGGWCAPSETLYDLCGGESLDGLVDIPSITVRRGGIRYTTGPNFSDIYTNVGFCQTEAQAIAGTPKTCYEVTCPPFVEVRLDACGICVKAPILTNAAYPELVDRWVSGSLVAHQQKMNVKTINAMVAALSPAVTANGSGQADSILTALELAAVGLRYQWRIGSNAVLEVVLPEWVKPAIRGDLAARTGEGTDSMNVSDAQIAGFFAARNLAVQFVYGWQETGFLTGCVVEYPGTVEAMIYPAGTFIKGTADIISLDTIYDTTDLMTNVYTAVFVEEAILVAKRCYGGCLLTIPVCVSGQTGAADRATCFGPVVP
jgi:hypothetical protein